MEKRSKFTLSKWYMDCVSDDGEVFIGYAAALRWRGVGIDYSSTLQHQHGEGTKINTSLQKLSTPQITALSVHWISRALGVDGTWSGSAPPIERTVFRSEVGSVEWRCLQPNARAEVHLGTERCIQGRGYAEHILISIPPWRLPVDELRWGRFLTDSNALVWIDWRGSTSLTLLFRNGIQIENPLVTDREVACNRTKMVLAFEDSQVLREGRLVNTALSVIPGIAKLLPGHSLRTYECKWRSRGVLKEHETVLSTGWAIHELVRFG